MAIFLHIETATKVCSVALSEDGCLLGLKEINEDAFSHGEQLTILIQQLMEEQRKAMSDLSAVSVSAGPGSYTGLRIGVSTAKGLCYALSIPLLAIDTLDAFIEAAQQKHPTARLCAMIDARRMEVFSQVKDAHSDVPLKITGADILDETSYQEFDPFVCFGDGAPKMMEGWKNRPVQFDLDLFPSASGQVRLAFEKFQTQSFEDVAYFEPSYLKEFYMPTKSNK